MAAKHAYLIHAVFLLSCGPLIADEEQTKTEKLVAGRVVDAETGEAIRSFHVLPGTFKKGYTRDNEDPPTFAVWQPHLIRAMTDGVLSWPRSRAYEKFRLRIEAEGYEPAMTAWTGRKLPQITPEIRMRRAKIITGVVVNAEGRPAAGATLSVSLPNSTVRLDGCNFQRSETPPDSLTDFWRSPRMWRCDRHGKFEIPVDPDVTAVVCAVHEQGYFDQPFAEFAKRAKGKQPVTIVLNRWSRVEGQVLWLDKPGVGEKVSITVHRGFEYPGMIEAYPKTSTDENGKYSFDHVPPGSVFVNHYVQLPKGTNLSPIQVRYDYPKFSATLLPGETRLVDFGGTGMIVTGKLEGLDSYQEVTLSIRPPAPETFSWFKMGMQAGGEDLVKGYHALKNSSYGPLYFRDRIPIASDGTFRIENVLTGEYELWAAGAGVATKFTVSSSDGNSLDLGVLKATLIPAQ